MSDAASLDIAVLPGDGIGPEITAAALRVLDAVAQPEGLSVHYDTAPIGGAAIDAQGEPLPADTLARCRAADAVLLGAVGGPKWDGGEPGQPRPEQGLLALRAGLGVYCNLRPARLYAALAEACPLKPEVHRDAIDLVICRELTGGIYFGKHGRTETGAYDIEHYEAEEIRRIVRRAIAVARGRSGRLTLVDKANVLESSRLWRELCREEVERAGDIELDCLYVDNAAMQLIRRPWSFDVIVTSNLFGDILSDEAAEITGSIGLLPSASLGDEGTPGLFEPIHGSAPDLAGRDLANPLATILSVALLLRYAGRAEAAARRIERAVEAVLDAGLRTADLRADDERAPLGCEAMAAAVIAAL